MSWISDMPFLRKLRIAMLLISTMAMLLACALFLAVEYGVYRQMLMRTVVTLAHVTAENSTAAIAFSDTERARGTLATLRAEPQIVAAALCTTDGRIFASYTSDGLALPDHPSSTKPSVTISNGRLVCVEPVIQNSRWLGTLYLWASLGQVYGRMRMYGLLVAGVLAASFAFAWILSSVLRRTIARPILELAKTAGAVTEGQDYSLRAKQYGTDELGQLTFAFNAMLERVQSAVTALRASESQLRIVTDNASVFLAHIDRDCRYKFVNRPYAERFGLRPDQVIGNSLQDVLGAEVVERVRPHIEAVLRGERVHFETEVDYRSGERHWMHTVYMPERGVDGTVVSFVAIVTDITRRKKIEEDVARARDEALAASRSKDDFLAALSHELRTPLNPVLLLASESARDPRLSEELRADFETIRKHVELEARLIDDLLDLTAITRGKLSLEMTAVDLHAVLRDAVATVSSDIEKKQIDLQVRYEAGDSVVRGDAVRLQQAFWNVLKNAVKFTPEGGRVKIEMGKDMESQSVFVSVSDTGIGFSPTERDRIFDAFSQGERVKGGGSHQFGGLGLGLAISKMVIELHQGRIAASSAGRGRGATFSIELPLATETPEAKAAPSTGDESVTSKWDSISAHEGQGGRGRVLLVEDHAATRKALERLLTRRHFLVTSVGSLADARNRADLNAFDLLISDVGLPDGSGYELMEELGRQFGLPGIALTGYGMEQDRERSFRAGFSAHLTKPVGVKALEAALATVLEI